MELTVSQLCDRYNLNSRKSLYTRLKGVGIEELTKKDNKSIATEGQIKLLDQQHEHLKNGGTIKNFVPTTQAEVILHNTSSNPDISSIVETAQHNTEPLTFSDFKSEKQAGVHSALTTQTQLLGDIVESVTVAIAPYMQPTDPLWYMTILERARVQEWELTTSQVKELIGVKPVCNSGKRTFKRGSFIFVKSGKIGNQTAWKVQKVKDAISEVASKIKAVRTDDGYEV